MQDGLLIACDLGSKQTKHPLPPHPFAGISVFAIFRLNFHTILPNAARERPIR